MNLTIKTKLLLLFLALAVLPMAIGIASYLNSVRAVEEVVEQRSAAAIEQVAAGVRAFFAPRPYEIQLLAWNQEVQDLYARYEEKGTAAQDLVQPQLQKFLHQFLSGPRQAFAQVAYFDLEGGPIFSYSGRVETGTQTLGPQAAFAGEDPALSRIDLGPYQGRDELFVSSASTSAYGPILRLGRWVVDPEKGRRLGFVLADLEVDRILQQARISPSFEPGPGPASERPGVPRHLVLIERENDRLLFHPQPSLINRPLDQAFPGLQVATGKQGRSRYKEGDEEWLFSYAHVDELNWTLALLSPLSQPTEAVRLAGQFNLGITFAVVLVALILIPLVIGRITRSIRQVTAGAEAIASGDLDQQIQVRSGDETRTLAEAFNSMALSLKTTLGDLRNLNEDLEDRVQRRTAELEEVNQTVQQQNQRLSRENAAEHVRNEALSMRSSEDIYKVVAVMWQEMVNLGIETPGATIAFINAETNRDTTYLAGENPRKYGASWTSPNGREINEDLAVFAVEYPASEAAVTSLHTGRPGTYQDVKTPDWWKTDPAVQQIGPEGNVAAWAQTLVGEWIVTNVPFQYGLVGFREKAYSEQHVEIVQELAEALALGYLRALDFQRLEEQNQALEEANEQIQEANRLKSEFLANMSHELRTPMNAIVGFTKIVLRRASDQLPERQVDNLEKVLQSSEILMNLINDILDLSKIEAGRLEIQPESFSLRELVESCLGTVSTMVKAGVESRTEMAAEIDVVHTDPTRVRQVLINLLSNAAKFTEKGSITVSLQAVDGEHIELAVADTGIGIPPKSLDYIFDEFRQADGSTTRKYGGTGLGLSITQKLAQMLGGHIRVESEVDKGSSFIVTLPTHFQKQEEAEPEPRDLAQLPADPSKRLVLSIDDDPNVLSLITQELEDEGYQVVGATQALDGIEKARQLGPHAITLDIMMPGMDGWEAIGRLKSDPATRDIPLIVISIIDNKELGFRLGADEYMVKPIDKDALLNVLQRFEGKGRQVLVADDDPVVVDLARQLLEEDGWSVRSAANGQQALDEIARQRPDVLLLDLMMPVMDGFETLHQLRENPATRDLPVVVFTAKDLSPQEQKELLQHTTRVIHKNGLDPQRILRELRESLGEMGPREESPTPRDDHHAET